MDKNKLLRHIVILMIFMFVLQNFAWQFHWYYSIWWFDIVMHFLGGFWVGLFFFYIFYTRDWFSNKFLAVVLSLLLIGVLWEVFEFYMGVIANEPFPAADTLYDIFFDLAGGFVSIYYFHKQIMTRAGSAV